MDDVLLNKLAAAAIEKILRTPEDNEKKRTETYEDIVRSAVLKKRGHVQNELPSEVREHDGTRLYTVTTIASSSLYGGTRTVVVCSSFERAKEIVESNEGDIWESSYHLVVIEGIVADWLYYPLVEQYWYVWEDGPNGERGCYQPIERPSAYERICNFGVG